MKDTLIWCDTKEKLEKVAQKLKSDGFSITDTETIWRSYGTESVLSVHTKYKSITYCSRDWYIECDYATPITADEFLGKSKNPHIVIFRRGREVIAKDVATGNEGIAKCSPSDEFVFKTGASIALARLMAKTPDALNHDVKDEWIKVLGMTPVEKRVFTDAPAQSKTPEAKFKVGDYVTLKEDVEADKRYGGLELLSGAMYDNAYNKRMTVVRVDWSDDSNTYYCECKGDSQFTFYYSEEMLDKWDESKIHEGDTVKVINTGLNYSSYVQWVEEHISDPSMAARFCFGSPSTDKNYKVIKIGEHEMNHRPLAYIEEIDGLSYNSCYLIEVKGLEKA